MELVRSPGLIDISTSANRKIVWYYAKNIDKVQNYNIFLYSLKSDLTHILETHVKKNAIKFNLILEAIYNRPRVENYSGNRAFSRLLNGQIDAPHLLERLSIQLVPNNTRSQGTFYVPTSRSNFSADARPLLRMMCILYNSNALFK